MNFCREGGTKSNNDHIGELDIIGDEPPSGPIYFTVIQILVKMVTYVKVGNPLPSIWICHHS